MDYPLYSVATLGAEAVEMPPVLLEMGASLAIGLHGTKIRERLR